MARLRWSGEEGNYTPQRYWWVLAIGVFRTLVDIPKTIESTYDSRPPLVIVVTVYLEWRRLTRR
jgi:hypothetical protein